MKTKRIYNISSATEIRNQHENIVTLIIVMLIKIRNTISHKIKSMRTDVSKIIMALMKKIGQNSRMY